MESVVERPKRCRPHRHAHAAFAIFQRIAIDPLHGGMPEDILVREEICSAQIDPFAAARCRPRPASPRDLHSVYPTPGCKIGTSLPLCLAVT